MCWHCGKKGNLSTWWWKESVLQQGSCGTTAATSSHELSAPHLASFEKPGGNSTWTYDTGAAVSAIPRDANIGTETEATECSYKTASGDFIPDNGGLCVQGTTEHGYRVTFRGGKSDVHKTLISASEVHNKGHVAASSSLATT